VTPELTYLIGYRPKCSINYTRRLTLNKLTRIISTTSTFSESNKFNGTNWTSWQRLICTMAMSKEAFGYLDGSIKQPPSLPADKASKVILKHTSIALECRFAV